MDRNEKIALFVAVAFTGLAVQTYINAKSIGQLTQALDYTLKYLDVKEVDEEFAKIVENWDE